MTRIDVINKLIKKFGYKSYLEIGIYRGGCFNSIDVECKRGVDPNPIDFTDDRVSVMTSDEYFKTIPLDKTYDIVFIDGLHDHKQILKDVENSLNHLAENGTIVLHDCNPPTEWHQREISEFDGSGKFNGTVWRGFVEYRSKCKDLNMFVIDCDWGIGVIRRSEKVKFPKFVCNDQDDILSYGWLEKNRQMALNLISPKRFQEWIDEASYDI